MKDPTAATSLTLLLLALSGCGGSTRDGTDAVRSGIPSGKALGEVTPQEAARGCVRMKDAIAAHFDRSSTSLGVCTVLGLDFSSEEAECIGLRDACLSEMNGVSAEDNGLTDAQQEFDCSDPDTDGWQGCSATVGEMEACLNDMLAAFDTLLTRFTCADASTVHAAINEVCLPPPLNPSTGMPAIDPNTGLPYVDDRAECEAAKASFTSPAQPKSCQALQTQCPNLDLFGASIAE